MHRPVKVAHSSFIEGSHMTKNTAFGHVVSVEPKWLTLLSESTSYCRSFIGDKPVVGGLCSGPRPMKLMLEAAKVPQYSSAMF